MDWVHVILGLLILGGLAKVYEGDVDMILGAILYVLPLPLLLLMLLINIIVWLLGFRGMYFFF